MVAEYKEFKESVVAELIEIGEKEGLFKISGKKIEYLTVKKSYNITDPEEQVRMSFYYELIKKYQYPKERIDLEVIVPRREPTDKADIVVYEDDEKKKPYIVVECKKDGISQAEIKQAIEQAFGNANSLRSKYTILVAGNVRIAFDISNFPPEEREKNIIADIPVRYGKVIKFKYKKGDPQWDLRDVTRDELLAKFQQCHDTLWEGGKRNPAEAFDEMSKLMYCKIQDERFLTKKGEFYKFQVGTYETINEVAERIRKIYKDAQEIDPEVFIESIKADNPIVYTVAEILQGISLARTDLDVKGEGYEHFLGGVFRGAMGQYFTPRPIVRFMIDFLEPSIDDFLIDPACGSGGFLIYTLERMRKELFTKLDEKDAAYRWQDFALKQVYGIEINSQLARVSMMNMIIHEDGHTNIENADALDNPDNWKRQKIREYFSKKFTLLLTNPPFGASVKEREKPYLPNYELGGKLKRRNRQNTEILFIERCLDFLKPGGRMGIVLPDGILTNSSLQYVRDFVNEKAQILGVVSLPQTAFKRPASKGSGDSGSGVKASLLFLRKKREGDKPPKDYPIFMAIAEHIGYDATGRPDKDEFPDVLKGWREFRKTNRTSFFVKAPLCFAVGRGEGEGRIDPFFHKPEYRDSIEILKKYEYPLKKLKELVQDIKNGSTPSGGKFEKSGIPFIRSQDFDLDGVSIRQYITESFHKRIERSIIKKGDVLIAVVGATLGQIGYVQIEEGNVNQNVARLRIKDGVNSKYLAAFLASSIGQKQIFRASTITTQSYLNTQLLENLLVPFLPLEIQDRIATLMDEAYKIKKEKESKAEILLNSIEPYVLRELGIKIEEIEEKVPKVFSVTGEILKGGRLDPFYHEPRYKAVDEALRRGKYELIEFGKIISEISGGATPKAKGKAYLEKGGIPFLRVQNITEEGIKLEDVKFINEETHNKYLRRSKLKSKDLIFTITGRIGTVAVVPEDFGEGNINQHSVRIHLIEGISERYIASLLNTNLGRSLSLRGVSGGTRIALDYEAIRSILIPLPPLPIQEKIANGVYKIREKAKQLREEAKELLEKAKREVEEFIEKK
jgi:type I restriction enzyme M protein